MHGGMVKRVWKSAEKCEIVWYLNYASRATTLEKNFCLQIYLDSAQTIRIPPFHHHRTTIIHLRSSVLDRKNCVYTVAPL